MSAALISLLLRRAGVDRVFAVFAGVDPGNLAWAFILMFAGIILKSYKLQILLNLQGLRFSLAKLVNLYLVGKFFNNFLPTTIGGDFVKVLAISAHSKTRIEPAACVFMDRITGFISLAALTLAVFCFSRKLGVDTSVKVLVAFFFAAAMVIVFALWSRPFFIRVLSLAGFFSRNGYLAEKLTKAHDALCVYKSRPGAVALIMSLSFLFHVIDIEVVTILARSLGISTPASYFFLAVPIINILIILPVSLNGIGIREGAFVFFFSKVGIPQASILALSLLLYASIVVLSLAGGLSYTARRRAL